MTELEQFAADLDASPPRIVLRQLQNQLLDLWIETWPNVPHPDQNSVVQLGAVVGQQALQSRPPEELA
jgi:hypothetical protein